MIYIVSYDLIEPGQKYEDLIKLIKQDGKWARLGDSAYLVDHIKQNWDKLKGKVILDCHNICPLEGVYHI